MTARPDSQTRRFQIGVVHASLRTPLRGLRDRYTALYRQFRTDQSDEREVRVEVRPRRRSSWRRRRYEVTVNGRLQFEPSRADEILPYIEWSINWEVPKVMPEYLQLHASSMEVDGAGVIFPGQSGSGKSTLTAGLLTRGWRYLCDEFALIHSDALALHPYPRAICVKKPAYPVIQSLGLRLHGDRQYIKGFKGRVGFISPVEVRPNAIGQACPIRYVIFPKYTSGATPTLIPIGRAEAAFDLHAVCFNLFGCRALGLDVLAGMIRQASCYRLISGEIAATCDLVQQLVEHGVCRQAQSA